MHVLAALEEDGDCFRGAAPSVPRDGRRAARLREASARGQEPSPGEAEGARASRAGADSGKAGRFGLRGGGGQRVAVPFARTRVRVPRRARAWAAVRLATGKRSTSCWRRGVRCPRGPRSIPSFHQRCSRRGAVCRRFSKRGGRSFATPTSSARGEVRDLPLRGDRGVLAVRSARSATCGTGALQAQGGDGRELHRGHRRHAARAGGDWARGYSAGAGGGYYAVLRCARRRGKLRRGARTRRRNDLRSR